MAGITSRASGQSIRLLLQNNRNKVGYLGMIVESTGGFVVAPEGPEKFSVRPGCHLSTCGVQTTEFNA